MNETTEISLNDIFSLLWSKLIILIAALIVGASGIYSYSKFVVEPKYSSHISMYVQTYTGIAGNDVNAYNDINKSKQLINTYIEVLKDDAVMESVGDELVKQFDADLISNNFSIVNDKIKPSSLASAISISTVADTSAIYIVATTKNAELSAAVCNILCAKANYFTDKAIGVGEINSIDTAKVYNTPVSPNAMRNAVLGGFGALVLAAAIIIFIDFFDNTIKNSETLGNLSEKAVLGEVSEVSQNKKNDEERISLLNKDIPFNVIETYKSIRTSVGFTLSTSDKKIFVVSSANPGEGKSTASANIAITMAEEGKNILLIDADMRKPVQHKTFNLKNKNGLSSVLSKMNKAEECIQKTSIDNLNVLTSGPIPPNPSELLSSAQTEKILSELSEKYDTIIIDTPPVNVVSDSLNLSPHVAGMIAVVKSRSTTQDDVKELISKTELAHMDLLGFVITRIKSKSTGKYYKRYGKYKDYSYGYGYGTKPEAEKEDKEDKKEDKADKKNKKN